MKYYSFIITLLFYVFVASCSSVKSDLMPTNNKGGYKIAFFNNNTNSQEVHIYGKVYAISNKNPISNTVLTLSCFKTQTDSEGNYSFKIKSSEDETVRYIKAVSVGYKTIETEFFTFNNKKAIKIDFFLTEDDRPIVNCEGNKGE